MPGTHSIQPGETADAGYVTFTCPPGGSACDVTVTMADDGTTTVMSVGGMATAMDSAAGTMKLAVEERIAEADEKVRLAEEARDTAVEERDTAIEEKEEAERLLALAEVARMAEETLKIAAEEKAMLLETVNPFKVATAMGYGTVTPGVYEIDPGDTYTHPGDDVTFKCTGPELCVVVVVLTEDDAGDPMPVYTSLGGAATGTNSMSVTNTIEAIALHRPVVTDDQGTEITAASAILTTAAGTNGPAVTVKRNTDGSEATITLTHEPAADVKYSSQAVDSDEIDDWTGDDWSGQTLKRSDDMELPTPQEATVYTNIEPATPQKLKLGDGNLASVTPPDATNVFVLDSGQDEDDTINMDESMFRITYNGVPGTFTCVGDSCADIVTATDVNTGQRIITDGTTFVNDGWTFESDDYVETVATQDADYMYFGYWLQSPDPDPDVTDTYEFTTFAGGADNMFDLETGLTGNDDEALTATYEGGAAGRYVTRKLGIEDQGVDPQSPGYSGRFTARATLTAHFGMHDDFDVGEDPTEEPATHNSIGGTITDFRDGATGTDLGFAVTLVRIVDITDDGGAIAGGMTTATFSETATSTVAKGAGAWDGQYYGPNAADLMVADEDTDATDANTLPSGVAGTFDASSRYTAVVGAYAAEKQ